MQSGVVRHASLGEADSGTAGDEVRNLNSGESKAVAAVGALLPNSRVEDGWEHVGDDWAEKKEEASRRAVDAAIAKAERAEAKFAQLGEGWGTCEGAFAKPQVSREGDHSALFTDSFRQIVDMTDQVYIICVGCEKLRVHKGIAEKVTLVNGRMFDLCDMASQHGLDHYKRASLTHAAAVVHAEMRGFRMVSIIEDDARFNPRAFLTQENIGAIKQQLLGTFDWNVVRMGYRPYTLELSPANPCPGHCACQQRGSAMCKVAGPYCDIRSSVRHGIDFHHLVR